MRDVFSARVFIAFLLVGNVASATYIVSLKFGKPKIEPVKLKAVGKTDLSSVIEKYRKQSVRPALALKNEDVQVCFEEFLRTDPARTRGAIKVSWIIDQKGEATDIKLLSSDLNDKNLEDCVAEQIKSTKFSSPPVNELIPVAHKFNFQSRSPASISFE